MQNAVENGVCRFCGGTADEKQSVPYALPRGTVLHGCYLLGAVLGAGGFGITYIALHIPSGRRVAVKEFLPVDIAGRNSGDTCVFSRSSDPDAFPLGRERFLREAQTIYRLRGYAGIVSVEKLFEENNTAYYCMEYLDGRDLRHRITESGGRLHVDETVRIMSTVLDALSYIHARGVIHRDVSPDNIFLCSDGSVKLIDFGAAYALMRENAQKMQLVVKHGYAPTEQYMQGGNVGAWSDLYAFSCTMYHCLTGVVPAGAPQRELEDTLVPPSQLGVPIPAEMERALLRGMAVHERDRYHSAEEMRRELLGSAGETRVASGHRTVRAALGLFLGRVKDAFKAFFGRLRPVKAQETVDGPRPENGAGGILSVSRSVRQSGARLGIQCTAGVYAGNVFPLLQTPVRLGRDARVCGIVFPSDAGGVSRSHCEVYADPENRRVVVRDVGSSYGTQIVGGGVLYEGQEEALPVGSGFLIGNELFTVVTLGRGTK